MRFVDVIFPPAICSTGDVIPSSVTIELVNGAGERIQATARDTGAPLAECRQWAIADEPLTLPLACQEDIAYSEPTCYRVTIDMTIKTSRVSRQYDGLRVAVQAGPLTIADLGAAAAIPPVDLVDGRLLTLAERAALDEVGIPGLLVAAEQAAASAAAAQAAGLAPNERAAMTAASSPSEGNPFATIFDVPSVSPAGAALNNAESAEVQRIIIGAAPMPSDINKWHIDNTTYDTITGTISRPIGAYTSVLFWAIGPGGAGGSGARIATAGSARSGGGGGSGGNISWLIVPYSSIGDQIEYYIGGIARGGAAATAVGNGASGNYADCAYIGLPTIGGIQATGGLPGAAGGTATAAGGDPRTFFPTLLVGGPGGAGTLGAAGGAPLYVGPGGGGAGGGGGISAAGVGYAGGYGLPGSVIVCPPLSQWSRNFVARGGGAGASNGANGGPGEDVVGVMLDLEAVLMGRYAAGGGAGGHAGINVPGGAGGRGGHWGGSGGGGGAALGAGPSGAGGDGGAGAVGLLCW